MSYMGQLKGISKINIMKPCVQWQTGQFGMGYTYMHGSKDLKMFLVKKFMSAKWTTYKSLREISMGGGLVKE